MTWIHPLTADVTETAALLGAKAHGLIAMRRLGLPVPPGFVITTEACRAYFRDGRLPAGLDAELAEAVARLAAEAQRPLAVSVRSGSSVSMPGMMNTILNHRPDALEPAITTVFASWHTPRAQTYRELHGIPDDLGTAVTVQAMVYGDRDEHSGSGVAFSRDPSTGEHVPFGDVLFRRQGDAVVSGTSLTSPLHELAAREPAVWSRLLAALDRLEDHYRDACYVEFTYESGELWLLQARPGRFTGSAAVRLAVDLADAGTISRAEALRRIPRQQRQPVRTPRIANADILTRGLPASPGVAVGILATTPDRAARLAADGPVILVRPETSPLDLHGLAAAAGVLTARGGPASHAAVVARSMGKPAVVGAADLTVDATGIRAAGRTLPEGTLIAIDGTGGEVAVGTPRIVASAADPHLRRLLDWAADLSRDP
ncbi:pyruvate, phosphate dikinase [Streptomyces sp. A7024]|uniref:Pyruvate, phosphate dikinase n=1 Tax=Streptomyces coryli TaxID=1128680 RepID=A0A6G4UET0_9ACTN|nr:PEP/pyruvate-binding domain-containing protein [Streptomyces coryli]NGN70168.1 pyruvate, phosphate dikinase [Streptomyces coryli]